LAGASLAVVAAVVGTRFLWIYPATYLPRYLRRWKHRDCAPLPPWQNPLIESWSGLRGVVTLATALALPRATDAGAPFPQRSFIIFLSFVVILATLVGQGLTLPPLLRRLGVEGDKGELREETLARRKAALAALRRLDDLEEEPWIPHDLAARLRQHYHHVLEHLPESLDPAEFDREHVAAHERLRQEMIDAQRQAIIALRDRGKIADDAMRRIERDLDLEELHSEI
jgi:CPA1 family monovalent cation:H+ antiporter